MTKEVDIAEHRYRIGNLNAFQQFHVARRLAPVFAGALPAIQSVRSGDLTPESLIPVAEAMAKMTDGDSEYVISTCLGVVFRQDNGGWAPVRASNGGLMYQDIDMSVMMQLTWQVLEANLSSFFAALPVSS